MPFNFSDLGSGGSGGFDWSSLFPGGGFNLGGGGGNPASGNAPGTSTSYDNGCTNYFPDGAVSYHDQDWDGNPCANNPGYVPPGGGGGGGGVYNPSGGGAVYNPSGGNITVNTNPSGLDSILKAIVASLGTLTGHPSNINPATGLPYTYNNPNLGSGALLQPGQNTLGSVQSWIQKNTGVTMIVVGGLILYFMKPGRR